MLRTALTGFVLVSMILVSGAFGADPLAVAQKWLTIVDKGEYAESWNEAAEYFKTAVPEGKWVQMVQAVRYPLGKIISRKIKSTTYTASLPGCPDGQYVVIQIDSSFEHKKTAIETVTPMLDKDGNWRVAGYCIN